jgi:hypothetical protein
MKKSGKDFFSCYTGLRYADVSELRWREIKGDVLTTRIIQKKNRACGYPYTLSHCPGYFGKEKQKVGRPGAQRESLSLTMQRRLQ